VAAYCNIGAGHAVAPNGYDYYVLQAAYTDAKSCGAYNSTVGTRAAPGSTLNPGVPQIIVPVKVATPGVDGKVWHVVQAGQSLWSIAIAYKVTIKDIDYYNDLAGNIQLQVGQKLFIPSNSTTGYATPTQVGLVQVSTPGADGKIIHVVQPYQTLTAIAQAYGVKIDTIVALNDIQVDWPLSIGQKLVIHGSNVTPSPTARPLTPIEKLTPASDGKYYHVVLSGQTLSGIATLYGIKLADLLAWNNMNMASLLYPGEKLLLEVTPPATATATPAPATDTPTITPTATITPSPSPTATLAPSLTATLAPTETATPVPAAPLSTTNILGIGLIAVAAVGLVWVVVWGRKKG
jgi:LysM repeat protein